MEDLKTWSGYFRTAWTIERRWFFQFFVSILICLNNGACFCFGIFSPFMKEGMFKYNQSQVNIVSTIGVILSYFSLPTGFLFDAKGPKLTLMAGTALNFAGWFGMFLIFINMDHPLLGTNIVTLSLFYGISQFSASFYETGSVLTNLEAFSCYQGRVILIQKTFMGLGSSIIVQIYIAFFETHFEGIGPFFLFLMFYSLLVGILGTLFVRLPTERTRCLGLNVPDDYVIQSGGDESHLFKLPFNVGTVILISSTLYILTVTLVENFRIITDTDRTIIGICTILSCLSFSMMIFLTPSYSWNAMGYSARPPSSEIDRSPVVTPPLLPPALCSRTDGDDNLFHIDANDVKLTIAEVPGHGMGDEEKKLSSTSIGRRENYGEEIGKSVCQFSPIATAAEVTANKEREEKIGMERSLSSGGWALPLRENIVLESRVMHHEMKLNSKSLWYNLRRREIWLMWYVCFASWSSATLVSTNSSQIYKAMDFDGYSSTTNVVFVSIYGVASAVGRVFIGLLHPILLRRKVSILVLFCIAPVLNFIGLPSFLVMPKGALAVPFFLIGLATGVSWGCTILIIKAIFTHDNCGKHYSALYTAGIVSPLVFNVGIFGPVYDYYSREQGRWDERECMGRVCIWAPLIACAVVNLVALPLSIYLCYRVTKRGGLI